MNKTKVFVYGTLKKGSRSRGLDRWGEGADFIGHAVTSKPIFSLYDLGAFPAVGITGSNHIAGEVWSVNDDTMADLDRIEGYPAFYKRTQIDTTQGRAWIYFISDIENYHATFVEPNTNQIASWRE
jgi:gamma-glutamylaminecyclotransferase